MSNKVIQLPVRPKDNTSAIVHKTYEPGKCQHIGVTYFYSEAELTVTCGGCGTQLDPVWVIVQMAQHESRWRDAMRFYQKAKDEHEQRKRCKCNHCGKMTKIRGM